MRATWLSDIDQRRILWPSVGAAGLPFTLLWLPPSHWKPVYLGVAGALALVIVAVALVAPRTRFSTQAPVVIAFIYLGVIIALRVAGGNSGVAPVGLLPVFWLALYGTPRQLASLLVAATLTLLVPLALGGATAAPLGGWRAALLLLAVTTVVGVTLQSLVTRLRQHERERERLVGKLAELAHTDSLTGLANRRAWEADLDRGLARARRTGEPVTVALGDIDHFKEINDSQGHAVGDRLLAVVARNWSQRVRPGDLIARIGGDEFAVLLPACTEAEAAEVLDRLCGAVPQPHSCSFGLATWDRAESPEDLMRRADDALYDAKLSRDRFAGVWPPEPAAAGRSFAGPGQRRQMTAGPRAAPDGW